MIRNFRQWFLAEITRKIANAYVKLLRGQPRSLRMNQSHTSKIQPAVELEQYLHFKVRIGQLASLLSKYDHADDE